MLDPLELDPAMFDCKDALVGRRDRLLSLGQKMPDMCRLRGVIKFYSIYVCTAANAYQWATMQ